MLDSAPLQGTYYKEVRSHASTLYGVLKKDLQQSACACQSPHNTTLQLKFRGAQAINEPDPGIRFRFAFSLDRKIKKPTLPNWRELELECLSGENKTATDSCCKEAREISRSTITNTRPSEISVSFSSNQTLGEIDDARDR